MTLDKSTGTRQRRLYFSLTLLVYLALIGCNALWVSQSDFILHGNSAIHALNVAEAGDDDDESIAKPLNATPFFYTACSVITDQFPPDSPLPFFLIQAGAMLTLGIATYFAGEEMDSPAVGFYASTMLAGTVQSSVALRTFSVNYPSATLVMLLWLCYLKSDFFRNRGWTWGFVAISSLMMLFGSHTFLILSVVGLGMLASFAWSLRKTKYVMANLSLAFGLPILFTVLAIYLFPSCNMTATELITCNSFIISGLILRSYHDREYRRLGRFLTLLGLAGLVSVIIAIEMGSDEVFNAFARERLQQGHYPVVVGSLLDKLAVASLWLRGFLLDLRGRAMGPLFFTLYIVGFIYMFWRPGTRWRNFPILLLTAVFPLFVAEHTRSYVSSFFPTTALASLVAASWLPRLGRFASVPVAFSALSGLAFCAGWLLPLPLSRTPAHFIHYELIRSLYTTTHPYRIAVKQYTRQGNSQVTGGTVLLAQENRFASFFSTGSAWSPEFLFTAWPYHSRWSRCADNLHEVLPRRACLFVSLNPSAQTAGKEITSATKIATMLQHQLSIQSPPKEIAVTPYTTAAYYQCVRENKSKQFLFNITNAKDSAWSKKSSPYFHRIYTETYGRVRVTLYSLTIPTGKGKHAKSTSTRKD